MNYDRNLCHEHFANFDDYMRHKCPGDQKPATILFRPVDDR